jgi:transcriptional regulator with XRE-family HTH domain
MKRYKILSYQPSEFVHNLRAARTMTGLTQLEVAKRSGLQACAVSHFENGTRLPSLINLRRLCMAIGCSADMLLGLGK